MQMQMQMQKQMQMQMQMQMQIAKRNGTTCKRWSDDPDRECLDALNIPPDLSTRTVQLTCIAAKIYITLEPCQYTRRLKIVRWFHILNVRFNNNFYYKGMVSICKIHFLVYSKKCDPLDSRSSRGKFKTLTQPVLSDGKKHNDQSKTHHDAATHFIIGNDRWNIHWIGWIIKNVDRVAIAIM